MSGGETPKSPEPDAEPMPLPPEHEALAGGFEHRLYRFMGALGVLGAVLCWYWRGWRWAAGFAIGAMLSALNFRWLHSAVNALAAAVLPAHPEASGPPSNTPGAAGSAMRIIMRYALIALVAYAIFVSSLVSLSAFFIGLFLFLGAVLVEAGYELFCGFRRT